MSKAEQDTILMKLLRDRNEAKAKLVALLTKAAELGSELEHAGRLLKANPAMVVFEGQVASITRPRHDVRADVTSVAKLMELTQSIRDTEIFIEEAEHRLKDAGLLT